MTERHHGNRHGRSAEARLAVLEAEKGARVAEDFAIRAAKTKNSDCWDAGYDQLAGLYIVEGDLQKAAAALESLKKQFIPRRFRPLNRRCSSSQN